MPRTPPEREARYVRIDNVAYHLDDIDVDESGQCSWADVANAITHIKLCMEQEAKLVAWRWRYRRDEELGRWFYNDEHPSIKSAEIEVQPLFAAPGSAHQPQGGDAREDERLACWKIADKERTALKNADPTKAAWLVAFDIANAIKARAYTAPVRAAAELTVDQVANAIYSAPGLYLSPADSKKAADAALNALKNVQKIISEAALTGFNCKDGDWPERLFHSQQETSAAIKTISTVRAAAEPGMIAPMGFDETEEEYIARLEAEITRLRALPSRER